MKKDNLLDDLDDELLPEDDHIALYMAGELEHREIFIENNEEHLKTLPGGKEIVNNAKAQLAKDKERFKIITGNPHLDAAIQIPQVGDNFGPFTITNVEKTDGRPTTLTLSPQSDLFGEPIPVKEQYTPPPVIIGEDIIKIRALTGKAEKQAKEALRAATVEMMDKASPDCFYIPHNTASSKNNKEIGFYWKKNPLTGKNEKVNILVDSERTTKYRKATAGYWLQNKVAFLNQTRHLPIPLEVEFTFIRDSMRRVDFLNACQVCCDLMVEHGWLPDDDTVHIVPVFNKVVYYHPELAGVLIKVIK